MIVDKFDDKQNSIVVFAHGNPNGFHAVGDNFNVIINTPQKFLSFLESQSDVWKGRYVLRDPIEIVLFSCSTGDDTANPSFAKRISESIGDISIFAPDADILMHIDEGYSIVDKGRNWKEFRNGEVVNEYRGDSLPGSVEFDRYNDLVKNNLLYEKMFDNNSSNSLFDKHNSWFLYPETEINIPYR